MSLLKGKKALILGVANNRSLAYGIAKAFKNEGASLALSYLNDALKKRVGPIGEELGADFLCEVDVTQDEHLDNLQQTVEEKWGKFDILVHSLAWANTEDLKGHFSQTSRAGFAQALDISAYSLVALCGKLKHLLNDNASVIALSYLGATKVVENYNLMGVAKAALESSSRYLAYELGESGVRVNCISAGPVKTLAASGVSGFRNILSHVEERAPLKRNISQDDVGGMATYLASDYSKNVTGQTLYVDAGHSTIAF